MTNIGFLHSLFRRKDGRLGFVCLTGFLLPRLCKKSSLGYAGGQPNPLNPPCQGDLSLNSPLIRGARGVRNDKYWFFAQSLSQERRQAWVCVFDWIPASETVQEVLARLRWRTTQPPKSPLSGGLVAQFPPDKGGKGG